MSDAPLTASAASRAGLGRRTLGCARAVTVGAFLYTVEGYILFDTENRFLKGKIDAKTDIVTSCGSVSSGAATAAKAATESTAEDTSKYVSKIKSRHIEAAGARGITRTVKGCVTVIVVCRTFFGVGKYSVRLVSFLELCLGFLVTGIYVGVIFFRKVSVCFFQLVVVGVF